MPIPFNQQNIHSAHQFSDIQQYSVYLVKFASFLVCSFTVFSYFLPFSLMYLLPICLTSSRSSGHGLGIRLRDFILHSEHPYYYHTDFKKDYHRNRYHDLAEHIRGSNYSSYRQEDDINMLAVCHKGAVLYKSVPGQEGKHYREFEYQPEKGCACSCK